MSAARHPSRALVAALATLLACRERPGDRPLGVDAGGDDASALHGGPRVERPASSAVAPSVDAASGDAGEPSTIVAASDAAAGRCAVLAGPLALGLVGPVALAAEPSALVVVASFDGDARMVRVPIGPPRSPLVWAPPIAGSPARATSPPCALAGADVYCVGRSGAVTRSRLDGEAPPERVAEARPLSPLAAASLASGRSVVAYLRERMTAEGALVEAFAATSRERSVRLSEDGVGATSVSLARRGDRVVAVALDARAAMATLHARELSVDGATIAAGPDTVIAVAGPVEPGTVLVAAGSGAQRVALMAASRDAMSFGLAAFPVRAPLAPAEPTWSTYPNGLTPAPVAVAEAGGRSLVVVARPAEARATSPRIVEVGTLTPEGRFTASGVLDAAARVAHLAAVADRFGTLWIAQADGIAATTLTRVRCAP